MTLTLRGRIVLTLVPVLALLLILGSAGVAVMSRLGGRIDEILRENYDSVVAMERLREAVERIDSSFSFTLSGEETKARAQYEANWPAYREALRFEQGNITLPGEAELVEELTALTEQYQQRGDAFYAGAGDDLTRRQEYYGPNGLLETFTRIKAVSGRIAQINQDNMELASRTAKRTARVSLIGFAIGLALALALTGFAGWYTFHAILGPVRAVTQSARGVSAGNLDQVVPYLSRDALGDLADAFNQMTLRLREDQQSAREQTRELVTTTETLRRELSEREQLEQSLRQLAAIVESSDDAIFSRGPDGTITSWNKGAERLFGYPAEAVLGQSQFILVPPEYQGELTEILNRVHRGEHVEHFETVRRRKDGKRIWASLTCFPVLDETGTHVGVASIVRDITGRKRAEEEIRRASAYNRSLLEASLDPLVAIGPDGKITDVNAATETATGFPRSELMGQDFADYFTEPRRAREGYRRAFGEGSVRDYPLEIRHRDGQVISVLYNAAVYRDEGGKVAGVFAAARDVTERKKAEEKVRRLARLQEVVADLGQRALRSETSADVLDFAVRMVAQTLGVEYCKVLELLPGGEALLLQSGVGWKEGLVGRATVGSGSDSQAGYTLLSEGPVVVEDLRAEKRFSGPPLLHDHGVVSGMSVIIPTSEGPYGVLGTHTKRRRSFTEDEVNFLQAVANVLGAAIQRKRGEEQVARLALLQTTVAELGQRALRSETSAGVLDDAVRLVAQTLGVDFCNVLEVLPGGEELLLRAGVGWKEGVVGRARVPIQGTQPGYVIRSERPVIVPDTTTENRFTPLPRLLGEDAASALSVVIATPEGPYGALGAHSRSRRTFTQDEVNFLQAVANVLGAAIQRQRAEDRLRRLNQAHRALSSCNEALIRTTDEAAWLEQVCRIVVETAGYRLCWVGYAEQDEARTVRPVAQAGFDEGYLKAVNVTWADTERGRGPTGTCIRTGQTAVFKNLAADPAFTPWRAEAEKRGYASSVGIPLIADSTTLGSLTIYAAEPDAFGDEEVKLLTELAGDLAFGVMTLRTRAERAASAALAAAHQREVEIGFKIQQMLLLDPPPADFPGLHVAALTIPSQKIDGDFYSFYRHENQQLDVIVADVMGKGIPAALLGAATKSQFHKALCRLMATVGVGKLPEPREIVTLAHAEIGHHLLELESFVTLCYLRLDPGRGHLDLVDCGHTGLVLRRAATGRCEIVHGDNLALGLRRGEIFDQLSLPFAPGDLFLLFSDGVTETRNPQGEFFGVERLLQCVERDSGRGPDELVQAIRGAAFAFSGSESPRDDWTCVAMKAVEREMPLGRAGLELHSDFAELRRARELVRAACHDPALGAGPERPPLDDKGISQLELAVTEACSNIMRHAYHGRTDRPIHLEVEIYPKKVSVLLHHLGDPFDPAKAVPPPAFDGSRESGFGLYILSQRVDAVRYYRDDRGWSCVALDKARTS